MATGISRDDVYKAADQLLIEGERPTIERVRLKLGRGSPNTVTVHLDAWFKELGNRLKSSDLPHVGTMPERLAKAMELIWHDAIDSANEQAMGAVKEEIEALQAKQQDLDSSKVRILLVETELRSQIETASATIESLRGQLERVESNLNISNEENRTLQGQIGKVRDQLASTITDRDNDRQRFIEEITNIRELNDQQHKRDLLEIDNARQTNKELKNNLDRVAAEYRQTVILLSKERDGLREEVTDLKLQQLKTLSALQALESKYKEAVLKIKKKPEDQLTKIQKFDQYPKHGIKRIKLKNPKRYPTKQT